MGQDRPTMKFTGNTFRNDDANNGLGEFQARFVVVKPGHEQEAENLMQAFHSTAGRGVRIRDGVVGLGEKALKSRIDQLSGDPKNEEIVGELQRGLESVQRHTAEAKAGGPAVTAKKQGGQVLA